jgi:phenolic acid decarboxylase
MINMLASILGKRLRWTLPSGWIFEPAIVGPDTVDYVLKAGPHAGRHAIQHFWYHRVAPGVETTAWYEESGAIVHFTWYLERQTIHRFAALPAWLAEDMTIYIGDNQNPEFLEKIRKQISTRSDWPRRIIDDQGFFEEI